MGQKMAEGWLSDMSEYMGKAKAGVKYGGQSIGQKMGMWTQAREM
jgi:hypothetical protein